MKNVFIILAKPSWVMNDVMNMLHEQNYMNVQQTTIADTLISLNADSFSVTFENLHVDLQEADTVYFRMTQIDYVSGILHLFPHLPLIQPLKAINYRSKLIQFCAFAANHLSIPKTIYIGSSNLVSRIPEFLQFPIVVKDALGTRGKNVFIAKTYEELVQIVGDKNNFLFQEYIENDKDLRIVIAGGKISYICERIRKPDGEWRNNVALGGEERPIPIESVSADVLKLAQQAMESLELTFAGVDVVIDKNTGKPYLLELNYIPGFTKGTGEIEGLAGFIKSFADLNQD